MTNTRRVIVHPDRASLASSVAARFLTKLLDILDEQDLAHIALTGGTVAAEVLSAIAASPARSTLDWTRVHFWWGDERWVPRGDADRNDLLAEKALLSKLNISDEQLHPFPSSTDGLTLEDAAVAYSQELARFASDELAFPSFDITFLGLGPDGHIASLFPGLPGVNIVDRAVISVENSPKPPPQRLSLTRPVLNNSQRVWLVLAGADKASALGLALAGASRDEVPAAGIKGRKRTVFFIDRDAAAEVPDDLITRD